jgi:hypothetical protein
MAKSNSLWHTPCANVASRQCSHGLEGGPGVYRPGFGEGVPSRRGNSACDSDTSVGSWRGMGDAERLLEAEERLRRRNSVAQGHINGSGNVKISMPLVVSSYGEEHKVEIKKQKAISI